MKNLIVQSDSFKKLRKITVHQAVNALSTKLNFKVNSMGINFVSVEDIIRINKAYLGHDYSTDIITFNYSSEIDTLDGEIYISYTDALENSRKFGVKYSSEILRLIIHGILHMLGHNDIKTSEKRKMRLLEDKFLAELKYLEKNFLR
ncbi:MAG: rRNA maturation RNase YbeY [bacterium]